MGTYEQRHDKRRISFFVLISFFALFLILSVFSINNVYGFDSESITSTNNDTNNINTSLANDSNQNNLSSDDNLDFHEESVQNISSNETNDSGSSNVTADLNNSTAVSDYSTISVSASQKSNSQLVFTNSQSSNQSDVSLKDSYLEGNYKNNNIHYLADNGNNSEKTEGKSIKLDNLNCNNFYSIFQYCNPNSNDYNDHCNDINNHINYNVVFLTSSLDFKGTGLENSNNFIKEVSNLNCNKIDDDEDTSIIHDFQSNSNPILNILFFIKIFMEHHDNGKEHLNSF